MAATLDDITYEIAEWRQLSRHRGARHDALGYEFTRCLRRNPNARKRVAGKRLEVANSLAEHHRRHLPERRHCVGKPTGRRRPFPTILDVYMSAIKFP